MGRFQRGSEESLLSGGPRFLGDIAGNFVKLHPQTERCSRLDMARVLVEVDLEKVLTEKICLTDQEGNEVSISVTVSYPWLPPRCNCCLKWGHKECDCNVKKNIDSAAHKQDPISHGDNAVIVTSEVTTGKDLPRVLLSLRTCLFHQQ